MLKRSFDIVVSAAGLMVSAPVLLLAAVAIRLSSPGPILYRARRIGRGGQPFTMHKLRTMHDRPAAPGSVITSTEDPRIFKVGAFLRRCKIDELPQLLDVFTGRMSIVGPRPEAAEIVATHYGADGWATLRVRPGLTSPGALYNYLHADDVLGTEDPEQEYVRQLLPEKLALEVDYLSRQSVLRDLGIILATVVTILLLSLGCRSLVLRWATSLQRRGAAETLPNSTGERSLHYGHDSHVGSAE